jgi:hypothetical protein
VRVTASTLADAGLLTKRAPSIPIMNHFTRQFLQAAVRGALTAYQSLIGSMDAFRLFSCDSNHVTDRGAITCWIPSHRSAGVQQRVQF